MAVAIKLPRMSDTMEEGTIVSWFVKVGDTVKSSEMIDKLFRVGTIF